jgi:hypothetical protein
MCIYHYPHNNICIKPDWSVVLSGYAGFPTTKTGCHDIAAILLKVALSTINQINSNHTVPSTKPGTMEYSITIWKSKIKFCLQLVLLNVVYYFQNVPLEHMALTVNTAVIHVLAKYVNHVMGIVHMT